MRNALWDDPQRLSRAGRPAVERLMFRKVLIANRGAIACRIARTLRRLGISSVAVYSTADIASLHVREADEAHCIGPGPALQSYLRIDAILTVARETGAEAIHPGYGFLSENAAFAEACDAQGIVFIGPTPEQMRVFGLKHTARALAARELVPLLPGSDLLSSPEEAIAQAERVGYPVMLKSSAGGGGIGMRLVRNREQMNDAFEGVERLARGHFKDSSLYLEKFVEHARHIEVQIFGDGRGNVIALGERDCSIQRRNQKVIEECPAPSLDESQRAALAAIALRLAEAVNYRSAGTVEFVYDTTAAQFYFLEVNTRLQVEHGVTEAVYGIDLVEWMVRLASGDLGALADLTPTPSGTAIEARLYAEDPARHFQPSTGVLTEVDFPAEIRVERWIERGTEIGALYDPMLAKLIAHGASRGEARERLLAALEQTRIGGIETNLEYLRQVVASRGFAQGPVDTGFLASFAFVPSTLEVLEAGLQTSIQDWPGRVGYWAVGVPPSGPMDAYSHRLASRLVGNRPDQAGLECTLVGPTLRFHCDAIIAVTGAEVAVKIDGAPVAMNTSHRVSAGSVLGIGRVLDAGCRVYLAVAGGIDVPLYLASRSTFALGQFGGHAGRHLRARDVLHVSPAGAARGGLAVSGASLPSITRHWDIGVLYGPHGAPDFFRDDDITTFFSTAWEVHYNSSRTGVRLRGPKPLWARSDGGEAGLHPSNIHDTAYAIGAINFTGDMPVILGPDGPSLGGFVCPAVVVNAELWKLGQLRPGDSVRFHRLSVEEAARREAAQERCLATLTEVFPGAPRDDPAASPTPILAERDATPTTPRVVYRQAGDRYLLVEYGPLVLDIELRLRIHVLAQALSARALPGIIDLTPGIRSLQIHYDANLLARDAVLAVLDEEEDAIPPIDDIVVPSRIVHLPIAWNDSQTRLAIEKYMQSVRADAPWCPSNLEFIRRMNGLESVAAVQELFFSASYLVLGLGDVYLGAPVAAPIDPRHRLVTTKYNPARTWTPENAVGIGGAYLCVYGMEGPGGYQFLGRTLQMWNRWRHGEASHGDFEKPWLLRFFDRLRFYPVSEDELMRLRVDFPLGRFALKTEMSRFSLHDYREFLAREAQSIGRFKAVQQAAFDAERERWQTSESLSAPDLLVDGETGDAGLVSQDDLPDGCFAVVSPVEGSVWQVLVTRGDKVSKGDAVLVVESMKMEFNLAAPAAGQVVRVSAREGSAVAAGQEVLRIQSPMSQGLS
jgi:urea carboxylase